MRLDGKIAIVTGAAQGLDRAIALQFAAEGADMLLADIQEQKVAQVAGEVGELGRKAIAISVDVTRPADVEFMVNRATEAFGRVDILVNDAGGSGNVGVQHIEDVSADAWDATVDLNLKGVFLCCRAVVPEMRRQGHGRIVNISSSSAKGAFGPLTTSAVRLPYAAAKSGVIGFTTSSPKTSPEMASTSTPCCRVSFSPSLERGFEAATSTFHERSRRAWLRRCR